MAKLLFKSGPYSGKSVTLPMGKSLTMGRNRDLELPLPDLKLSRRHCQINFNGERCVLKDLGSTNGTLVNGTRLVGEIELNDFDLIVLGDTEIEFHYLEKVPLPAAFDPGGADPFGLEDEPAVHAEPAVRSAMAAVLVPEPAMAEAEPIRQPAAIATLDPLAEALGEMCQALPPEPAPLRQTEAAVMRPMVMFCESCDGSVPNMDMDLGMAREIDGKIYCKECLAKGVKVGAEAGHAVSAPVHAPAHTPPPARRERSVDDILAALDDEAEVVDTTLKRGSTVMNEGETEQKMRDIVKMQQAVASRHDAKNAPVPAAKAPAAQDVKDELGEEFEEIG